MAGPRPTELPGVAGENGNHWPVTPCTVTTCTAVVIRTSSSAVPLIAETVTGSRRRPPRRSVHTPTAMAAIASTMFHAPNVSRIIELASTNICSGDSQATGRTAATCPKRTNRATSTAATSSVHHG